MKQIGQSILRRSAGLAALVLLAGCDQAAEQSAPAPMLTKLPAKLCAQASDVLTKLGKTGTFEHDRRGGATMDGQAWLVMGKTGQDQLAQTIAIDAACAANAVPTEQKIEIRSDDGRALVTRVVEITPDPAALLDE